MQVVKGHFICFWLRPGGGAFLFPFEEACGIMKTLQKTGGTAMLSELHVCSVRLAGELPPDSYLNTLPVVCSAKRSFGICRTAGTQYLPPPAPRNERNRATSRFPCHCEPVRTLAWQSVSPCNVPIPYLSRKRERIATSHGFLAMTEWGHISPLRVRPSDERRSRPPVSQASSGWP